MKFSTESDEHLMNAVAEGDPGSLAELIERYQQRLLHFFTRCTGSLEAGEALFEQTFLSLYRARRLYDPAIPFSTLCFGTGFSQLKNFIAENPSLIMGLEASAARPPAGFDSFSLEHRNQVIQSTLARLPVEQRAAVHLTLFDHLNFHQTGQCLQLSQAEARMLVDRACQRLQEAMSEFLPGRGSASGAGKLAPNQLIEAMRVKDPSENIQRQLLENIESRRDLTSLETMEAIALEAAPQVPHGMIARTLAACRQVGMHEEVAARAGDDVAREMLSKPVSTEDSRNFFLVTLFAAVILLAGGGFWWMRLNMESLPYENQAMVGPRDPVEGSNSMGAQPWSELPASGNQSPGIPTRSMPSSMPPVFASTPDTDAPEPANKKNDEAIDKAVTDLLKRHLREAKKKKTVAQAKPTRVVRVMPPLNPTQVVEPTETTFNLREINTPVQIEEVAPVHISAQASAQAPVHTSTQAAISKPPPTGLVSEPQLKFLKSSFSPRLGESASLRLVLETAARVDIRVFNSQGQSILVLKDGLLTFGGHDIQWDGRDSTGQLSPPGQYYLRVLSPTVSRVEPLELLP